MSWLTFIGLWFAGSCVVSPLIGAMLSRNLDGSGESRSGNRLVDLRPAPIIDRSVNRSTTAVSPGRRPGASLLAQRISARSRR